MKQLLLLPLPQSPRVIGDARMQYRQTVNTGVRTSNRNRPTLAHLHTLSTPPIFAPSGRCMTWRPRFMLPVVSTQMSSNVSCSNADARPIQTQFTTTLTQQEVYSTSTRASGTVEGVASATNIALAKTDGGAATLGTLVSPPLVTPSLHKSDGGAATLGTVSPDSTNLPRCPANVLSDILAASPPPTNWQFPWMNYLVSGDSLFTVKPDFRRVLNMVEGVSFDQDVFTYAEVSLLM
jgi:hypothetical protein